ncbi:MAG: 1-deoxy-D-xylulose-5-phosphate synthase [Saprospiraceae bacterium]|nr:1-deoxy-D-xylulose-5-phosphate synthase [Saprospiraceae bacterium]
MEYRIGPLLEKINSPSDLKKLDKKQLPDLCAELRNYIIDVVSVNGGHFGASLGVVELTVALHYVYDTPVDQLVWDVGHQAYGHKILTGRKDSFDTNRKYQGLSGFPKRAESEYDTFGVGHSSTSISALVGMAVANKYKEDPRQHIAVIGDGAMTGGMAFEGLNHAGVSNTNMLVILNDNDMSIDPNVGALKKYLAEFTATKTFNKFRDEVWKVTGQLNKLGAPVREGVSKIEHALKSMAMKDSNLFESFNMRYFGPADGHNVITLVNMLEDLKTLNGPKLLHIKTVKGKGYDLAEKDQTTWHAPGLFDKVTGERKKSTSTEPQPPKYQDVFGHSIIELAKANEKVVGVTPAMPSGCSMKYMIAEMPERAFDVGIAEQHAVTFSAGMATQGLRPFCNIYSTFMQRAYDQVIHDVAIQKLPVIFCLDRGGLVGADGPTHHGAFDLAYFRCIPNMIVSAPMNEQELRNLMYTAQLDEQTMPFSIRYPRGKGVMPNWKTPFEKVTIGTGRKVKDGEDVAILTIGHPGNFAVQACAQLEEEGLHPAHFDMRFVKPIDEALLHEVAQQYSKIITVEDGCIQGGFGSAVLEFLADNNYSHVQVQRLGVPDAFIEHGTQQELWAECGYDADAISDAVKSMTAVTV